MFHLTLGQTFRVVVCSTGQLEGRFGSGWVTRSNFWDKVSEVLLSYVKLIITPMESYLFPHLSVS
jgi:hypothetical protein